MDTVSCLCQVLGHNFFGEVDSWTKRSVHYDISTFGGHIVAILHVGGKVGGAPLKLFLVTVQIFWHNPLRCHLYVLTTLLRSRKRRGNTSILMDIYDTYE
jgi:hypothetical protein